MSGLADRPILYGTPSATEAQGRAYLARTNAAHAKARGIPPLAAAEIATICAAYWRIGARYGIDPAPALSQSVHETAAYTFGGQVNAVQHNPAGLGATNDGAAGGGWSDWPHGIEAHYIHLLAWANDPRGDGDYRFDAVRAAIAKQGKATSWRSLGGRWAVPGVGYGSAIEAIWAAIIAEKGGIVAPEIVQKLTSVNYWQGRNGQSPQAVVVHVAEGSKGSTDSWFHNPDAEASAHYEVNKDGGVWQYVREEDSAWANGIVNKPNMGDPLIASWINAGINPNRTTISIETEGFHNEDLTPAQLASLCWLVADIHGRYGWPTDGSRLMGHYEFDAVNRPNCPSLSAAEWAEIRAAIAGQPAPNPATPAHPAGYLEQGQPDTFNWNGEGVITARTATFYNPDEQAYYTRTWNNAQGFTPWIKVG